MASGIFAGLVFLALLSYLYGSLCWAIIISKWKLRKDIRVLGDGNPGAYNTGRNLGGKYFLLVMLLDASKGFIPGLIASFVNFQAYQNWAVGLAGSFSVLGHCYPIFFKFRGGNGFSTIFGFMILYNPWMVLEWGIFVFVLTVIFKYIRPVQLITMFFISFFAIFIDWHFYWRNFFPLLTEPMMQVTLPAMVLTIALLQVPRFIPYFVGIYTGTEEKIFFFKFLRKNKTTSSDNN
ncbi:MAG: glycerol-3-phosphate acyltransferase [Candidatus Heimdallarchaeota archaeon]